MKSKLLVGIGAGCGILCIVGIIILAFYIVRSEQQLKYVNIQVDAPSNVVLDDEFVIEIQIENTSDEIYILKDIDVHPDYLEGIFISGSEPQFHNTFSGEVTGYQNYKFDQNIHPKSELVVQLHAIGFETGSFIGDIDICINALGACRGFPLRTVVSD